MKQWSEDFVTKHGNVRLLSYIDNLLKEVPGKNCSNRIVRVACTELAMAINTVEIDAYFKMIAFVFGLIIPANLLTSGSQF